MKKTNNLAVQGVLSKGYVLLEESYDYVNNRTSLSIMIGEAGKASTEVRKATISQQFKINTYEEYVGEHTLAIEDESGNSIQYTLLYLTIDMSKVHAPSYLADLKNACVCNYKELMERIKSGVYKPKRQTKEEVGDLEFTAK